MSLSPEVKAKLTARFNARLPETLESLRRARAALRDDEEAAWSRVLHLSHQVAGTAGSFGWCNLTERARVVQRYASAEEGIGALDALVREIEAAIERCRVGASP